MSPASTACVFVSAVTTEREPYRDAVAQEIRCKELATRVQSDFSQGGGTLLE